MRNGDFNDWSTSQVGFGRFAVSQRKGARVDAATAYLPRKVRRRKNLETRRKKRLYAGRKPPRSGYREG